MSLLDDIIVNTAAAVSAVGKKTGELVDKSKLRVSSAELKKNISSKFESLGRYVYDTHMTDSTDDEVVEKYIEEISALIGELKSLQDSIGAAEDKIVCPKCSAQNTPDSLYCKKCGATLDFTNSYTAETKTSEEPTGSNEEPADNTEEKSAE